MGAFPSALVDVMMQQSFFWCQIGPGKGAKQKRPACAGRSNVS
jgi:hypothetical protein